MGEPFMSPAGVYALLSDGRTVQIRPAAPDDFAAVTKIGADSGWLLAATTPPHP